MGGEPEDCVNAGMLLALIGECSPKQEIRSRCRTSGADSLTDRDVLTLLLAPACRADTAALVARRLLETFRTLPGVLNAPRDRILEIRGAGEVVADILAASRQCAVRCARAEISGKPIIECWSELLDYVQATMGHLDREQFRVLFLNRKSGLIADEIMQEGTVDHTPVYPREVMRRALVLQASAMILLHNHPSGDPTPSRADIDMTRKLVEAGAVFGIAIHDHIIVAEGLAVSMKGLDLI